VNAARPDTITKVLIANRGEIAVRVIATCRAMGIATVAVYSDADRDALHVRQADEAVHVGPPPAKESYLDVARILAAARETGADAVHPGYGFLSENAEFARAVEAAGLVWVGPPPSAIEAMGSKIAARRTMEAVGVPVVAGVHDAGQDHVALRAAAHRIGFPVLVKAAAGGGGKGMKTVMTAAELDDALASAEREALAAFKDGSIYLEKLLVRPRHVEIQIFGDRHGRVIHLGERECSIQRRHQKVVEECPSPVLTPALRAAMGQAAVLAGQAVGYVGAGTVELMLGEDGHYYFLEMNTRLQVEHPVTEAVYGVDLVRAQLLVAMGKSLDEVGLVVAAATPRGHAVEVRLYAEDPGNGFLPATGTLQRWRLPPMPGVRLDTGYAEGDPVSVHYDPMLAKLIAWGDDREHARRRLLAALRAWEIHGVVTNLDFLQDVVAHPAYTSGATHTGFIGQHWPDGWTTPDVGDDHRVLAAVARALGGPAAPGAGDRASEASAADASPWTTLGPWRSA